jgi:hypothetical protein
MRGWQGNAFEKQALKNADRKRLNAESKKKRRKSTSLLHATCDREGMNEKTVDQNGAVDVSIEELKKV